MSLLLLWRGLYCGYCSLFAQWRDTGNRLKCTTTHHLETHYTTRCTYVYMCATN